MVGARRDQRRLGRVHLLERSHRQRLQAETGLRPVREPDGAMSEAAVPVRPAPERRNARRLFASWRSLEGPVFWLAKWLLRGTWFLVIPALLAALVSRYLVPRPWDPAASRFFLGAVARIGME